MAPHFSALPTPIRREEGVGAGVGAHHPRRLEARAVAAAHHPHGDGVAPVHPLAQRRDAAEAALRAEAVAAHQLHRREGLARLRGAEAGEEPRAVEAAEAQAHVHAGRVEAQLVAHAPGHREVALPGAAAALGDAHLAHRLGDEPVEVGVAQGVDVADLVHRQPGDVELHVLPVHRVEAAEEELLRLALARVLGGHQPRHRAQEVRRAGPRRGLQHVARHHHLAGAAGRAPGAHLRLPRHRSPGVGRGEVVFVRGRRQRPQHETQTGTRHAPASVFREVKGQAGAVTPAPVGPGVRAVRAPAAGPRGAPRAASERWAASGRAEPPGTPARPAPAAAAGR